MPTPTSDSSDRRRLTMMIGGGIAALVILLAAIAIINGRSSSSNSTDAIDTPSEYGEITITGTPLPLFDTPQDDTAIGKTIPTLQGTSFDDTPVTVKPGQATLLMFVAHWCPHCQHEVPLVTKWIKDAGGLGPIRLVAVATKTDPSLPNYPPSRWLRKEGLPAEFIRDDISGTAAAGFGLPAYPYFIAIDAKGKVVARNTGELTQDQFEGLVKDLGGPTTGGAASTDTTAASTDTTAAATATTAAG